jgi:hypothetical protein
MEGLLGGLYGLLCLAGRYLFAILLGPRHAERLPNILVSLPIGGLLGAIVGLFFPPFRTTTGLVAAWQIGLVVGLALTFVLAVLDSFLRDFFGPK